MLLKVDRYWFEDRNSRDYYLKRYRIVTGVLMNIDITEQFKPLMSPTREI